MCNHLHPCKCASVKPLRDEPRHSPRFNPSQPTFQSLFPIPSNQIKQLPRQGSICNGVQAVLSFLHGINWRSELSPGTWRGTSKTTSSRPQRRLGNPTHGRHALLSHIPHIHAKSNQRSIISAISTRARSSPCTIMTTMGSGTAARS